MIPIRLQLRNFLSYREGAEPLAFDSFSVACLSGDNGHGKSSLLDAITWALWGRARARTEDELIHAGAREMSVEFEFAIGNDTYRVIRKRSKRASGPSTPTLELQSRNGDGYRTLTGDNLKATEAAITALLRLDYDTFVHSSFLMQGKADSFTTQTPNDRKRILADILGLSRFDILEERAKERARAAKETVRLADDRLRGIEDELRHRPTYQADADREQAEHDRLDTLIAEIEQDADTTSQLLATIDRDLAQVRSLDEQIQGDRKRQQARSATLATLTVRVQQAEAVLDDRATIESGFLALAKARALFEDLSERSGKLNTLQHDRSVVQQRIVRARAKIEGDQRELRHETDRLSVSADQLDEYQRLVREAETEHARLEETLGKLDARRARLPVLAEQIGGFQVRQQQLRVEMNDLKAIIDRLKTANACWVCGQPLPDDAHQRLLAERTNEGVVRGDEHRALKVEIETVQQEQAALQREVAHADQTLGKQRDQLTRRFGELQHRLDEARQAREKIAEIRPRLAAIEAQLASGAFAAEDSATLITLDAAIAAIGFDAAALTAARTAMHELEPFAQRKDDLIKADAQIDDLRQQAADTEADIDALSRGIADLERRRAELGSATENRSTVEDRQKRLRDRLQEERLLLSQTTMRLGQANQKLRHCDRLEAEQTEQVKKRDDAARDQTIHDDLVLAFGKRGVQAMIIEAALPEIEHSANELLQRMTDGAMSVSLATQRMSQRNTPIDTLDIRISGESGNRAYEMFSGGEAFRINFAIRIALAKLLARRAGARLETLVIDEGFGTQDASGRDRLVEAIRSVEEDFAKILVVTHIDELRDIFPVQIQVTKTADGSTYAVRHR